MTLRPCLECGRPTNGTRCTQHEQARQRARNQTRTQYRGPWRALSRVARKQQPWCALCGTTRDLTLDHEHGQVECRSCNSSHRREPQR